MKIAFDSIQEYNCWDGIPFPAGYVRTAYLENISGYIGNRLIKVIVGQRRVGKSYILRQIMNLLMSQMKINPRNILFINKEFSSFDYIKTSDDLDFLIKYYRKKLHVAGKVYLFLDEIQRIADWETVVNSYSQDYTQEFELFITGSNSNMLSGELATLLSGRYIEFEVFPFSFSEYSEIHKLQENKENYLTYLRSGGLPELIHLPSTELQQNYISSLKNTIILRDIIGRYKIKDLSLLEDLFKFLSVNIGNLTSVSSIINYYKSHQKRTNYETLSTYLGHITETFTVHQVDRYNLRGKKILGGECKYYLNDLAFKNLLLGFYPQDIGYNLENLIFLQLRRMGYKVSIGKLDKYEIDFVAQRNDETLYIQVCYLLSDQKVIDREFGNLNRIRDNYEKIVISLDDIKYSSFKGIKHMSPWDLK